MCDRAAELTGKDAAYCSNCKFMPALLPANAEALELIQTIGWGLFDSMGGVNFGAIEAGFKLLEIPKEQHASLMRKLGAYAGVVREHQDKDEKKPGQTKYMGKP